MRRTTNCWSCGRNFPHAALTLVRLRHRRTPADVRRVELCLHCAEAEDAAWRLSYEVLEVLGAVEAAPW